MGYWATGDVITAAKLNRNGAVTKVFADSPYTILEADDIIMCDCTSGAITIVLLTAVGRIGKIIDIKKIDSSANVVTIDANGAETIDGAATKAISIQYDSYTIISDGTNWHII